MKSRNFSGRVIFGMSKITELGRQIYYRLKPKLSKRYSPSDYAGIEVKGGDFFIGKSRVEAIKKAQKISPKKVFPCPGGEALGNSKVRVYLTSKTNLGSG